jgi:hypothetical protein
MMKEICLACLLISGCASSTTNWVASSYSTIDQNYSSIGVVRSGHEPYPVVYLGDGIYIKLYSTISRAESDVGKPCLYGHNKFEVLLWSQNDIEFIPPKSYFVKHDGTISKIDRISRFVSETATTPEGVDYNIRQDAVPIPSSWFASENLISAWKNNEIQRLYERTESTYFDIELSPGTSCPDRKFQAMLTFRNPKTKSTKTYKLYFSPMPFKYYMLR